jgi:hypothetical protein
LRLRVFDALEIIVGGGDLEWWTSKEGEAETGWLLLVKR